MKRMLTTACIALAFVANGQADNKEYNYRVSPFYIQPQVGVGYSDNENSHFVDWNKMLAPGVSLSVGKEFSPLWGWRATVGYHQNRGAYNWRDMHRNYNYLTFSDVEAFADLTFDYSDLVFRGTAKRHWKVMLFAGVGGAQSFDFGDTPLSENYYNNKPKPVLAARGGVNVQYLLSDRVALSLEGCGTFFQDRFNGVNESRLCDIRSSLAAGVFWYLGNRKLMETEVPVTPVVPVEPAKKTYVIKPFMAYITPATEVKARRTQGMNANVEFQVNKTILLPNFRNNKRELDSIRASIDRVKNDKDLIITALDLHGYASPEGSYANNVRLAKGRVEALRSLIMKEYGFKEEQFSINYTPEDWEGLKTYLRSCSLQDKDVFMQLAEDDTKQPDEKEAIMRKMKDSSYPFLLKTVFPSLRHTEYAIDYVIRPFDVEEAKTIVFEHPEKLNLSEMFQVANAFGRGSDNYKKVCRIAAATYPDRDEANMNAACVAVEDNDLSAARNYLAKVKPCAQKTHAMAVIEALDGNYDQAREMLKQSAAAGLTESQEMLKQLAE